MKAILRATLTILVLTILTSPTSTQVNATIADGGGPMPPPIQQPLPPTTV